jgi:amino acid adenylation domain-containing protein/non-ribosomal peptide synthase protein (TIGR01720 family)
MLEDVYPLSPLQEGLYFHWLSSPDSHLYFEQLSYQLKGDLDIAVLEKSYAMLAARHAVLRTFFTRDFGEKPLQIVRKQAEPDFTYKDVSGDAGFCATACKEADRARGFDLGKGSQMRLTVIGMGNSTFEFIWSHHHILMDGWCVGILIKEFFEIYHSLTAGKTPDLKRVYPYTSYINWLGKLDKAAALGYWKNHLAGYDTISSLPRLAAKENEPFLDVEKNFSISSDLRQAIKTRCREAGITENTFVQTAWGILLGKYNNTSDVVFGSVVSGRPPQLQGVEEMIGLFSNTIPVRITSAPGMTGLELLRNVQQNAISGTDYHYTQLAEVQAQSRLGRGLMDHILLFESRPDQGLEEAGTAEGKISGESFSVSSSDSAAHNHYDFTLMIVPGDTMKFRFKYNANVYDSRFITLLEGHFIQVMQQLAADVSVPVSEIDYVTAGEKESLLISFNDTKVLYPQDKTVVTLFEAQVKKTPADTAVAYGDTKLTYRELDEKANLLASHLSSNCGIKPGDLAGIMLDRSGNMIVAILGILKSGAGYVPVDTAYPADRKKYIIQDAGVKVLVTQTDYLFEADYFDGAVFAIDVQLDTLEQAGATVAAATGEDVAYVIYTSGSTGTPKGCAVTHANLYNYIQWAGSFYFTEKGVANFGLYTSLSFDLTVTSIFCTLLSGGQLTVYNQQDDLSEIFRHSFSEGSQVDCIKLTPPHINYLRHLILDPGTVKCVIVGGEQVTEEHVRILKHIDSGIKVYNEYGPTETTVGCTVKELEANTRVLIGKPVANTAIYILDANGKLVAPCVWGEICIGGAGVAKGYLNKEGLTAEKFVPDPFCAGKLMYRTGDTGRWLPDGDLEFLGRTDEQVKIRGYRIEPGEIESALHQHPDIEAAAVIAKANAAGDKELVAWIVSQKDFDVEGIRTFLGKTLPAYMLPAQYMRIEALPLTPNGKTDRKQLQQMDAKSIAAGPAYVPPVTETERQLVAVYEDVLKKAPIGIKEDFFALGGDSIKSIQVVSRLRQKGYTLAIQDVLQYPVIQDLAGKVRLITRTAAQETVEAVIPLSPVQKLFFESPSPDKHHYNQSVLLCTKEPVSEEGLRAVLDMIVLHHDALRMVFRQTDNGWIQENKGKTQSYSLEVTDFTGDEAFGQYCDRFQAGFDLGNGPLFRCCLFRSEDGDRLLLAAHHLVMDGVSWRILLEDLSNLYSQYLSGKKLKLPLKTDSFKYWQERQAEYAGNDALQQEAAYWDALELQAADPLVPDHPEGSNAVKYSSGASFVLDDSVTEKLITGCYKAFRTDINDILLTGLGLALKKVFGLNKILISMEGHGRENIGGDTDVTRTIGWFTTLYPVLLDMKHSKNIIRQLVEVKENLHRIPNKGIGYGILRYMAGKEYTRMPEITFNYLGDFGTGAAAGTDSQDKQLFEFSGEYHGKIISDNMHRSTPLGVSGMMAAGKMRLSVNYSTEQFEASTIEQLVNEYQQQLTGLINRLAQEQHEHLTPVDLTYKDIPVDVLKKMDDESAIEDIYPLSPLQEGFYYHWLSAPDSGAYFEQLNYSVSGNLDIQVLEESYARLVARHPVLRTYFTQDIGKQPLQVVTKTTASTLTVIHVADKASFSTEAHKEADRKKGFDLHQGSQMRLSVFDFGDGTYEFIWSHHHILMDGWCVGVLVKEFFQIYYSLCKGVSPGLNTAYPYSGYINWLGTQSTGKAIDYWKNLLSGYDTISILPQKNNRQPDVFDARERLFSISETVSRSVRELCTKLGITENTFIQVAWGILLGKYNNTSDVVFGSVVSGRPGEVKGIEEMMGLFINTIPVRIQTGGKKSVREILKEAQQKAIEGMDYHYTQLAQVKSVSEPGRDLFDHILQFQNIPVQDIIEHSVADENTGGLTLESFNIYGNNTFNFTIIVFSGPCIGFKVKYNGNLYDDTLFEQVENHFVSVIEKMLEAPAATVDDIEYLSEQEKQQLLVQFNSTATSSPAGKTIIGLFEEQVLKTPGNTALVCEGRKLSYSELDEKAAKLAYYLRSECGVNPNDLVGIMLDRSENMIVAILGIMKAGGAYVAIEPDNPRARKEYVAEDTAIKALITQADHLFNTDFYRGNIFAIDIQLDMIEIKDNIPHHIAAPDNLAYVLYTSGSTGQPKGVMVTHRALVDYHYGIMAKTNIHECTSFGLVSTIAADLGNTVIFTSLMMGGELHVFSAAAVMDPGEMYAHKLDCLKIVPSHWKALQQENAFFVPRKCLIFGGEKLTEDVIGMLADNTAQCEVYNHYGPSETTIGKLIKHINLAHPDEMVTLGSPFCNTAVYITDNTGKLVPAGITGEICISGDGLAKGYLNNALLTDEKFVANPFRKGERMYKTGDLGRWLPDGTIAFAGRKDDQVKIRGYRIELGEIENTLASYPSIAAAAVTARVNSRGENELVAYIVTGQPANKPQIQGFLEKILPSYMIPSFFVEMDMLPLTSNGKIDRKKLPDPGEGGNSSSREYVAPRNETEEKLVVMWQEILGKEKIGVQDSFFELGGHSLKVVQLISRINTSFLVRVNIQVIFKEETIENISEHIQFLINQNSRKESKEEMVEIDLMA